MAKATKHGVIGLGRMGTPVAQRLKQSPVRSMVWDVDPARRRPFEASDGVRIATPGEMARRCAGEDMSDDFNVSTAFSYSSRHRFPNNILNGSWNARARIYNPWKDVGLAIGLARKYRADVQLGERTLAFPDKAVARGMIEQDYSLLYRDFDRIGKTRPAKHARH
jgi:3-hydroxyisobutyrate dehydrogenase-like beta-hydroxyacid dehydrogenase